INRESWCTIKPCPDTASLLAPAQSPECENFLDVGLGRECASKQGVLKRESGSDSDLFHSPSEEVDSIIFPKVLSPSVCDSCSQPRMQPARRVSSSVRISPHLLKSKTLFSLGCSYSSDEEEELHNSRPFLGTSANLTKSITEETYSFLPQSPSKKDFEGKSGTKVSRTFSYIKNKMSSSKKSREKEKEKEKIKEKEKDSKEKEKDKKIVNGHTFSSIPVVGPISCSQCVKPFTSKDAYTCAGKRPASSFFLFSGENAERLKKTYGKFCGQHNQSVNYFKDIYTKDKRFQAFVKKKMSSAVVRRLGIPECILLVTQRITKYPVLFQRILQCTKDNDVEQEDLAQSLSLVKDVIGAVDSKVASYEKKVRLNEIYTKTDSKSIMRMKSGQMFAKEDLKRKKLVRDGAVFLKNAAGRLKEVQAVLLTDILVFLQEKDQKYVFASLDQKSTVISLKKLIVREVAHEEKGLFLISMGMKDPEMVEVHASSKEERNSWIQIVQDTINTLNRDEDEGIPSENEEEKRMLDTKARELKEQLQQKDQQILLLLEEKEMIFRDMAECSTPLLEDCSPTHSSRILFRSNTEEALKGGPLMKSAINEVEILQGLVSGSLGGTLGQAVSSPIEQEGMVGPVSLPRRAETFGGFDSHQMNASKGGEKEEGEDGQDLRRTESDSGLKKGGNANVVFMLKRNSEQVVQSVVHLHELLSTLQGVVLQQDSYIEDQKLLLAERVLARSSSRPSSLVEQEKQRSLEKQRQDLANLQRQQAQHQEEKRRREREWEARERALQEREARLAQREQDVRRGWHPVLSRS
ncbi:A-kinase anchor protein 13-like, partial [Leptonychotes weddellii]|uniref:A-kinase anchor protein 13-like n=1 Tax=Leptonychotes weddellii TaxID=9713 RepID=A0A7F8RP94_LEPWE